MPMNQTTTTTTTTATATATATTYYDDSLSVREETILDLLFGTSSCLSVVGSSCILFLILVRLDRHHHHHHHHHRRSSRSGRRGTSQHHLLVGLSASDLVSSTAYFASIFWSNLEPGPLCTFEGLIPTFSLISVLYNTFLSVYYLLTIRYGIKQSRFGSTIEPWCHLVAISYPLIIGLAGIVTQSYNPSSDGNSSCLFSSWPIGCVGDECTRGGQTATSVLLLATVVVIPIAFCVLIITNILIYCHVRKMNRGARRFSMTTATTTTTTRQRKQHHRRDATTHDVAIQSFLYVGAFFLSYSWTVVVAILDNFIDVRAHAYPLLAIQQFFFPLQGFWNCLVFIRPSYVYHRRQGLSRKDSFLTALYVLRDDDDHHHHHHHPDDVDDKSEELHCSSESSSRRKKEEEERTNSPRNSSSKLPLSIVAMVDSCQNKEGRDAEKNEISSESFSTTLEVIPSEAETNA